MEGLGQILPSIISGGSFASGTIGNILEERKRANYQNMIMDIIKNPAKLAALVAKLQKPMDNALVQGVTNQVQGNMAERGLSQAPGIFAGNLAQSLAPYEQQNYNSALNAVMQTLGMPAGTFGAPMNNSGALQLFLKSLQRPAQGGGGNAGTGGFTLPPDAMGTLFPSTTGDIPGMTPQV